MITLITDDQGSQIPTINALFRSLAAYFLFTPDFTLSVGLSLRITGGHVPGSSGADLADTTLTLTASTTNYVEADATTYAVTTNTTGFTSGRIKIGRAITNVEGVVTWKQDFAVSPAP